MNIELHELLVRLRQDNYIRVRKVIDNQRKGIIEGVVGEIDDLFGYHHDKVENVTLTMTNTLLIDLEGAENQSLDSSIEDILCEVAREADGCVVCSHVEHLGGGYMDCFENDCHKKDKFKLNLEAIKREYNIK